MKYKEEIQVIATVNEFWRFHTNPSNQHYANYNEYREKVYRVSLYIFNRGWWPDIYTWLFAHY